MLIYGGVIKVDEHFVNKLVPGIIDEMLHKTLILHTRLCRNADYSD